MPPGRLDGTTGVPHAETYDLNLLVALDALLTEGSVTGAARRLHLSVPATSRALSRLRREFNDPLLVKAGRGLVPTERAVALQDRVRQLLDEAHALPCREPTCDPATLHRDFLIVAGEAVLALVAGPLLSYIEAHAPLVRCAFLAEGPELLMRDSPVDLAIGASRTREPEVRVEPLLVDRMIGVCRRGHPLLSEPITRERYLATRHLGNSRWGHMVGPIDAELGITRNVVASAPIVSSLSILLSANLVGVCYEMLEGPIVTALGLATFEIPYTLQPMTVYQAWHPRHDVDAGHLWMRDAVRAVVADLVAERAGRVATMSR
jgi:DNA-binding transcriptional LysR family regulator